MRKRASTLKAGDTVIWNTSRGRTVGVVKKKLTTATHIKTHKVKASSKSPEYLVKSKKTGKLAAHKAAALKKGR